jgi:hypothetical protein
VYLIRRPPISIARIQVRAIAAEVRTPSVPIRSLAACTTNTSSRPPVMTQILRVTPLFFPKESSMRRDI